MVILMQNYLNFIIAPKGDLIKKVIMLTLLTNVFIISHKLSNIDTNTLILWDGLIKETSITCTQELIVTL